MGIFTFIQHPMISLHDWISSLLPGIEKVITVYSKSEDHSVEGLLSEKKNRNYTTKRLNLEGILPLLRKYMNDKTPYDWYSRKNLPFDIDSGGRSPALDIFSELQNVVLLIRLPQKKLTSAALVFLYLNENPGNFGVTNSINHLTTDNKTIIAFLMRNMLEAFIEQHEKNVEVLLENNQATFGMISKAEAQKREMTSMKENYGLSLIKLCRQHLAAESSKTGRHYSLSTGAMEVIKTYSGDIKALEEMLIRTLHYVNNLYFGREEDIEILEWHLQFEYEGKTIHQPVTGEPEQYEDKYFRTVSLLDKLEDAALKVKSYNLKMTGTNVGQHCPDPITAPAISDALFNHKSKITNLMTMYPGRWETIRREFRPLKNIVSKQKK
ncbi:MAG: hypothetical protein ACNA7V_12130 [Bacteroidales bacterium]